MCSCSNDAEESDVLNIKDDFYWVVFEGSINGNRLSVSNEIDIFSKRNIICFKSGISEPGESCDSVNVLLFGMRIDSLYTLQFTITDFQKKDKWLLTISSMSELKSEYIYSLFKEPILLSLKICGFQKRAILPKLN